MKLFQSIQKNIPFLLIAITASALLSYYTGKYGVSICVDCVNYMEAANSIKNGLGYSNCAGELMNHFPPFYSILLAAASFISGIDVTDIGIVLNICCLCVFLYFSYRVLLYWTQHRAISIVSTLWLLTTPMMFVFNANQTEPFFLAVLSGIVYTLLKPNKNFKSHLFIGILLAAMTLTRYAGVCFIAGAVLYIFIENWGNFKKISLFTLCAITPFLLSFLVWKWYTSHSNANITSRAILFHFVSSQHWHELWLTIKSFFFNNTISFYCLLLLLFFASISSFKYFKELRKNRLIISSFLGLMFYFLFLMVSISWVDFAIPFDNRLLAPASFFLTLFLSTTLFFSLTKYNTILYPLFILLGGVYLLGNFKKAHIFWEKYRNEGEGYNSSFFEPIPEEVFTRFCENKIIYTNNPGAVKLSFPNSCAMIHPLPFQYIEINHQNNINYTKEWAAIMENIKKRDASVIYLLNKKQNELLNSESMLHKVMSDTAVHKSQFLNYMICY